MQISYLRQLDIIDPEKFSGRIRIIGCGGIGSPTAIILAKMGFKQFVLMDDDTVEPHNLPNQFYPEALGMLKVEALAIQILQFNPEADIETVPERFTDDFKWEQPAPWEIVIVATDTLKSRACVWGRCMNKPHIELYLDARMAAEQFEVHAARPTNIADQLRYEATLFQRGTMECGRGERTLRKPVDLPCTARAIAYSTFVLGGLVAHEVKKFVMNEFAAGLELRGNLQERVLMAI